MEKMGAISLLGCISLSLVAMEQDKTTQKVQRPLVHTQDEKESQSKEEVPTCGVCLDDMMPGQNITHTECTDKLHLFHTPCLAGWYAKNGRRCPMCRTPFKSATKKILEKERRKMRAVEEAAHPELRIERENKAWLARFMHFTAVGLGLASVVGIPLVLKEYVSGPGSHGPRYAEAASLILPTTVTVALPLEQSAQRLEEEIDS